MSREKIRQLSTSDKHYKYQLYVNFNPDLVVSNLSKPYSYAFSRLRLSSHSLPIETGRWNGTKREFRLCTVCDVPGDEKHFIYDCPSIDRVELSDIPALDKLLSYDKLPILLKALIDKKYL